MAVRGDLCRVLAMISGPAGRHLARVSAEVLDMHASLAGWAPFLTDEVVTGCEVSSSAWPRNQARNVPKTWTSCDSASRPSRPAHSTESHRPTTVDEPAHVPAS